MNEEWWEGIAGFLCEKWWILLLFVVLAITAYFTRDLWLPAITSAF